MPPQVATSEPLISFDSNRLAALAAIDGDHFWFAGRRTLVRGILDEPLVRGRVVLDVGCGTGSMLAALDRWGAVVTGVDPLPEAVACATRRAPRARVHEAQADALPIADASVDGVTLLDVLEHIEERPALREVVRVLRPGGWLLVTVPAGRWLWSRRDDDAGHLRRYSRRRLERVLRDAGLEVERFTRYQCVLLPVAAATRLLGRRSHAWRDREERVGGRLNTILAALNRGEARLAARVTLPWGTSLVALARKAP